MQIVFPAVLAFFFHFFEHMPTTRRLRGYGLWTSHLKPENCATDLRLSDLTWTADSSTLIWLEERSDRSALMSASVETGKTSELTPPGTNPRARLGYGGGDFAVGANELYLVSGGRIFRRPLIGQFKSLPITPASAWQPASPCPSPDGASLLYLASDGESDSLRLVDSTGFRPPETLDGKHDFYMHPRWRPSGDLIAWVAWDNPNMPWDGAALYTAIVDRSKGKPRLSGKRLVAGDPMGAVAVAQPEFSPDGQYLAYLSDETGWFNLNVVDLDTGVIQAFREEAEHGHPAWIHGQRSFAWAPDSRSLYLIRSVAGFHQLVRCFLELRAIERVEEAFSEYDVLGQVSVAGSGAIALIGSSAQRPQEIASLDVSGRQSTLRTSSAQAPRKSELSRPKPCSFTPAANQRTAETVAASDCHGLYYPPCNPAFYAVGLPPAVIRVHGGPTSQYTPTYHAETQFLTSRGFAVLELNYHGSSGYGRAYRDSLKGWWGIADVDDLCAAVSFLGQSGLADPRRIAATGSSAGGLTVFNALIRRPGLFKAAVGVFPVADLSDTTEKTHKLERHYVKTLVGPAADAAEYRRRSPLFNATAIREPIALYHGADDKVVPPRQSLLLAQAINAAGGKCECTIFPGEGHGWRKSETIVAYHRSLEGFLRRCLLDYSDASG